MDTRKDYTLHHWMQVVPEDFASEGIGIVGFSSGRAVFLLCLNNKTHATAPHRVRDREDSKTIMAITLPLSPFLCGCLLTSNPRGFKGLLLLPRPEYASLSKVEGAGGDAGRPISVLKYDCINQTITCIYLIYYYNLKTKISYLDNADTRPHNYQNNKVLYPLPYDRISDILDRL